MNRFRSFLAAIVAAVLVGCGGGGGGAVDAPFAAGVDPQPFALSIDGSNNVSGTLLFPDGSFLVAGDHGGTLTLGTTDGPRTTTAPDEGEFFARYDAAGALLWSRVFPDGTSFRSRDVFLRADGIIVVYASSSGPFAIDGFVVETEDSVRNYFLLQVHPADGAVRSVRRVWRGARGSVGRAAVSPDGHMTVAFTYRESASTLDPDSANPVELEAPATGMWSVAYAGFAPGGARTWVRLAHSTGSSHFVDEGLGYDGGDAVFACSFRDEVTFSAGTADETTIRGDAALVRYGPDGRLRWAKSLGGDVQVWQMVGVGDGFAIASSFTGTARYGPGDANETTVVSAGFIDGVFAEYAPSGTLLWARHVSGPSRAVFGGLTRTADGGYALTGWLQETTTFHPGAAGEREFTSSGLTDPFVARYDADGALQWVRTFTNPDFANGSEIHEQADGRLLVTGGYDGELTFGGGGPPDLVTPPGVGTQFLAQLEADGTLRRLSRD